MSKSQTALALVLNGSLLLGTFAVAAPPTWVGFEDLPQPPALDGERGLQWSNDGSNLYQGITWNGVEILGKNYAICPDCPVVGIPHAGNYAMTNTDGGVVTLTTGRVLMGLWVGQNEYYGYGGGADQVTVQALDAEGRVVSSVSQDLPDAREGEAEPLAWMNTAQFLKYADIAGYRVDRHSLGEWGGGWIGDDFLFVDSVPYVNLLGEGLDGPLAVGPTTPITVDLTITVPRAYESVAADWWLVLRDDTGFRYFDRIARQWVAVGGDYLDLKPTYQGGLFDLVFVDSQLLPTLNPGVTVIYAGVDMNMDGKVDLDQLHFDTLELHVQ